MNIEFESLISKSSNTIRNIARSYTNAADVDDLMQEILTQLWRSFSSFRGDSKFETWLYRIAINTAITFQRSEIKERKGMEKNSSLQVAAMESGAMAGVSDSPHGMSHDEILQAFVKELNKVDRGVLMMYIDGLTANEIESVLGIKANAIKVRISRLKVKFKQRFVD